MKKNQNLFIKKIKPFQSKRINKIPKNIFRKRLDEKKENLTSFNLNYTSPYYNTTKHNKFYILKGKGNKNFQTEKESSPIRTTYTKINKYKLKVKKMRPMSSSIRKLPVLLGNNNNLSLNFSPFKYVNLDEEKLYQEKNQLNKIIRHLTRQLNKLRNENEVKDMILYKKENQLNDLIYQNNLTEEEKDLNSIILNYQGDDNYIEESNIFNNQNNSSSYSLIQKIKQQIRNYNEKIIEEYEKIKKFKNSIIYTKLHEINSENELLEEHIKKIYSLLSNSLTIKESNDKKLKEIFNFEYNINIQRTLMEELNYKREKLKEEEENLQNNIKNIGINIDFIKRQVLDNTKELDNLRQKNKNLLNDKLINSKLIINKEEENNYSVKNFYITKISKLKKDIHFYKSKDIHDESIKSRLKEQKNKLMETLKQVKKVYLPSSILSLKENNLEINQEESKKEPEKNIEIIPEKKELDNENIEKLKEKYLKEKTYERKLEEKYRQIQEKFTEVFKLYQEQNKIQENNSEENTAEANNITDNNQNEIEFGIDKNNPFYTEKEDNNPEIDLKFNSTQYNQFTYILFKNFESKGIVSDESYNKIINPFVSFANEKKLKLVTYPSSEFDLIIEGFTKIILGVLNSDNKYNHSLTNIFLSALLINSGCDIQKMIEYFAILFSYTRDYKTDEDKYLEKLKTMFNKEIKEVISAIKNYLENNKNEDADETYFPLIKLKELIEENKINLKDKYVEFLFYYLKKFDDKDAKLDYLKCSKLNDIIEQPEENKNTKKEMFSSEEDEKKVNTEPNKPERFDNILKKASKNNILDNENVNNEDIDDNNGEEDKLDESATEISVEEYLKQLKGALDLIKRALKLKNKSLSSIVENKKKIMKSDDEDIEYILITDLYNELKSIGVVLSDLKLSCLCSKYCLQNDLKNINIKSLEDDLNSE